MSYPIFSWIPHQLDATTLFEMDDPEQRVYLDLYDHREQLSDLQVTPMRDVVDTYSIGGGVSRTMTRAWQNVRIVIDRFNDRDLFRRLSNMINHLERGGVVSFANRKDKCYASRLVSDVFPDDKVIRVGPNLCKAYSTTEIDFLNEAQNDEIVIEQAPPFSKRWHGVLISKTETGDGGASHQVGRIAYGGSDTIYAVEEGFNQGDLVRYHDFWPTLVLPKSQVGAGLLTHDHRITYTLDLNLQYIIPYQNIGTHEEAL